MRKLKLLFAAAALMLGVGTASAQTDVTESYIGDVTRIVNGGGHSHSSSNHKESDGIGWWNTQTLSGWHAFANPNASGGVGESWTSGFGSAGVMMGRTMVLPSGNYTLSFDAFACNATNSADPATLPTAGDAVAFLTGEDNVDITNTAAAGDATFHTVSFTFDVTTANTAYEFGIKKLTDGSKIDWCQIKNVKLTLNSDKVFPVVNNSIADFTYSGTQTWHTNTWSTEGQRDGSRFQVPFHELWVASGGKLNDATIKATFTPTETGVYKVSAWVRAMNEAGGAVTGAKIFVADVDADACTGSVVYDGKGRLGTYTAMADGVAGTPFEYGFILKNAEINWLAFKNVTITYLGTMPQDEIDALLAQVPTGKMNADIQTELNGLVSAFQNNASVANYNALSLYLPTAQASAEVYANINSAISDYEAKANALDAAGQAAYDASAIQTKYNNGTYATLSEAESELAAAFAVAVKAQTTEGSDWTALIINPSFESDFTSGWTNNGMARQSNTSFAKAGTYYAEKWQPKGTFGVSQTINLPAGVYRITAHAKARGVTSAKIYAAGIDKPITIEDSDADYTVEFACDNYADVTFGFEGEGTGATDSWLCVDNFRMTLVSAGLPDVTAVTGKMNGEVAQAQDAAIATYNANRTVANYNAASAAIAAAQTSIEAYTRALSAIESANALKEAHNFASAAATTTFAEAIAAIQTGYDECTLTNDEAIAALATLGLTVTGWHAGNDSPAAVYMRDGFSLGNFDKALYINTWSTEGAGDGSNFVVPFYEYWTSDANSLSNNTWTGTLNDIPNGLYTISAWVRVRAKNETAATDATGITMDVNGGGEGDYAAVDVTEGAQVGTTQFTIGTFTAQGIVNRGKLTLNFNISDANISWLSIKNIKYTKVRDLTPEEALIIATDEDYAALNLAINNAEGKTLGFEVNEYAPYNNTAAIALLAAAKAINQNVENVQKDVQAATTALNDATWTVNTEELNAFYDGDFSECAEDNASPLDYTPAGWTASDNMRMMLKNTETYPGLVDASAKSAMMSWSGGITYGETTGYTMPLKANTIYKLTFKAAGWNDETRSGITVSVLNTGDGMAAQNLGTPDRDIKAAQTWNTAGMTSYEVLFVTGAAGNYVFHVQSGNNMVLTDFEIKKAASQVLEFADGSVPTYAPGTYPTVKISRTLTDDKWATAIYPFALSLKDVDEIVVLDEYYEDMDQVNFKDADNSVVNQPFLMRASGTTNEIILKDVVVDAAIANNDVKNELSFIGVYKETEVGRGENVKNFVLKDNTIYRVGDNAATINPYRAYFQVAQPGEEARLKFFINGQQTTDIEGVKAEKSLNGVIYNLNGQRVEKANKGLYISNGKKVVLK